jgi:hypothetical protein
LGSVVCGVEELHKAGKFADALSSSNNKRCGNVVPLRRSVAKELFEIVRGGSILFEKL